MMSKHDPIKSALEQSCEQLAPEIEQKLNARRNLAISQSNRRSFRLAYALAPVALVALVWFNYPQQQLTQEEQALYEDIELLIMEDDLQFLDEMDLSDWLPEQVNDSDDA
jgi:DNA replication initiation complex subunit (GINS family)